MNLFSFLFCFSLQTKQICLFLFWENLQHAQTAFGFICKTFRKPFLFCTMMNNSEDSLFNRFLITIDLYLLAWMLLRRDLIGAYNIAFEPHYVNVQYLNQALFLVMNGNHLLFQLWYCFQFIL